ncbi:MAG: hypothetical protein WC505_04870 [Patescibacteria group bacterium]
MLGMGLDNCGSFAPLPVEERIVADSPAQLKQTLVGRNEFHEASLRVSPETLLRLIELLPADGPVDVCLITRR